MGRFSAITARTAMLFALGLSAHGCGGEEGTVVIDSRGRIEALVNFPVEEVTQTLSVSGPDGQSVFLMEHRGVFTVDGVDFGEAEVSHMIGLGLTSNLTVVWVRDFGVSDGLQLAGGVWQEPRAVVMFSAGELLTQTDPIAAPALLPIAFADGLALPPLAIDSERGALQPNSIASRGSTTVLAGTLVRDREDDGTPLDEPRTEAWARRYENDLSSEPIWDLTFSPATGAASVLQASVDSSGNAVVLGETDDAISTLSAEAGSFIAKLGAAAGAPLWIRAVNGELREDPITVGADDSVIVSSTVLE
ncbi:MAG: hypothetical protein AAFQ82_25470, partial [Myxococcota bacterium]